MLMHRASPTDPRTAFLSARGFWMFGACFTQPIRGLPGPCSERIPHWGRRHWLRGLTSFLQKAAEFSRLRLCAPERQYSSRPITSDWLRISRCCRDGIRIDARGALKPRHLLDNHVSILLADREGFEPTPPKGTKGKRRGK